MRSLYPLVLPLLAGLLFPKHVLGQLITSFESGFLNTPISWVGDSTQWQIVPFGQDYALRSAGPASPDTLFLFAQSEMQFGKWRMVFNYQNGALSNFNLARIYLASSQTLSVPQRGYYLQLGGNAKTIRLYRQNSSENRTLLGESETAFFESESNELDISILRSKEGTWTVSIGMDTVIDIQEDQLQEFLPRLFWDLG